MSSTADATPPAPAIPQFGRIYLTVIWVEGVLFGVLRLLLAPLLR